MVKSLYVCEVCKFAYSDKVNAQRCQRWCKENKNNNVEITKYAIGKFLSKNI